MASASTLAAAERSFGDVVSDNLPTIVVTGAVIAVAAIGWWVFTRVGRRIASRVAGDTSETLDAAILERAQRVETLWSVMRALALVVLLLIVVLTILAIWGIPIGPFVAVGSVVGIAVGFGAQNLIKDVIAGFLIVAEDQYAIGDVVRIVDVAGKVERIRLRTTVLRDLDGNVHHVPNGAIVVASNYTQSFAQVVVDLDVAYKEDIDHVLDVVADELATFAADEEHRRFVLEPPEILGVEALADWSVKIRVVFKVMPDSRWPLRRAFLRRIKRRFDTEGIEIPFPYRRIVTDGPPPDGA